MLRYIFRQVTGGGHVDSCHLIAQQKGAVFQAP